MENYPDYYRILELEDSASPEQIKKSFRRLSKIYHPDKNDSPDARLLFHTVLEAYKILSSPEDKSRYDDYLRGSCVIEKRKPKHGASEVSRGMSTSDGIPGDIISRLNYILWEIEDLIFKTDRKILRRMISDEPVEDVISGILSFVDKWILTPSGEGDYFFTARKIERTGTSLFAGASASHGPYVNLEDYFYQIRRRFDRFSTSLRKEDLAAIIPGTGVTLLDSVFEALRLAYHHLGMINIIIRGGKADTSAFVFSSPAFDEFRTDYALPGEKL